MRKIDEIVVHCAATPEGRDISVATIRKWHKERGFRDIGYHFIIYRDGSIHAGRPVSQSGAHARGHNKNSIGICYIGGVDANNKPKDTRTVPQVAALSIKIKALVRAYPAIKTIRGHRDIPGVAKACPSFDAEREYANILKGVTQVEKGDTLPPKPVLTGGDHVKIDGPPKPVQPKPSPWATFIAALRNLFKRS